MPTNAIVDLSDRDEHDATHRLDRVQTMPNRIAVLLLAAVLPAVSFADKAVEKALVGQNLASFEREAAVVRDGLLPGGVYGFMSDNDKARVDEKLDEMHKLLQDHGGSGGLSANDKVTLLNTQEELNALLLRNDNNRLVCERGAHTGSRIHVTTCQTYGEIMERQRRDRGTLSDIQRQPQTQRDGL